MNIVFLCREYDRSVGYGGIGTYVHNISKYLAEEGHKVFVISSLPREKETIIKEGNLVVYYAKQKQIPGMARLFSLIGIKRVYQRLMCALTNYFAVKRLLKNYHIDIIETPEWFNEGLFCELFLDIPVVCYSLGCVYFISKYWKKTSFISRILYFLEISLEILTMKFSDGVTALAEVYKKELEDIKIKVDETIPLGYSDLKIKNESTLEKKEFKVLFIGRIENRKNPITIIKAIPTVVEKIHNVKFIFVGKKDIGYYQFLENEINRLNINQYVEFLGQIEQEHFNKILKNADIIVFPSLWESFGIVLLEAIFADKVVLCSDIPVFKEIMGEDYQFLIPVNDHKKWAESIIEVLSKKEVQRKILEGYSIIKSKFSIQTVANKKVEYYKKVISSYELKKFGYFKDVLPNKVCGNLIPLKWRKYVVKNLIKDPALYHFYLSEAKHILEAIAENIKGKKIFDFGATPILSCLFALCGAEVTLIDIDDKEIKKANYLAETFGIKDRLKIIKGDFFTTQIEGKYDIVYNCGVIEHFSNSIELIKKMKYYTVKNGMVICLVPYWLSLHSLFIRNYIRKKYGYYWDSIGDIPERSYTKKRLKIEFLKAGLKVKYIKVGDIVRNICDDHIISFFRHRIGEWFVRRIFIRLFKIIDIFEKHIPFLRNFGFFVVCCGVNKDENN